MSLVGFVAVSGDRKGEETVMAEAEIMDQDSGNRDNGDSDGGDKELRKIQ